MYIDYSELFILNLSEAAQQNKRCMSACFEIPVVISICLSFDGCLVHGTCTTTVLLTTTSCAPKKMTACRHMWR